MPRPSELEAVDDSGSEPRHDQRPAEPAHANPIARIQILTTSGYIARHPTKVKVLEWLGWNNPGGSTNP